MGDDDGLKRFMPLDKGKISEFLEKAMDDAKEAQDKLLRGDHAPVPGSQPVAGKPNALLKPPSKVASLPEIAARTGMTREMAIEIRNRAREIVDMLDGAAGSESTRGFDDSVPASPLRQIDEASMDVHRLLEEAVDSIQTIHRQLFG